jgi:hypothetical protein
MNDSMDEIHPNPNPSCYELKVFMFDMDEIIKYKLQCHFETTE